MRVYIAGPMTGMPEWNRTAFMEAEARFQKDGWEVHNPIREDDKRGGPDAVNAGEGWHDTLRRDLKDLVECHAIALLPGWESSRGATLEYNVAQRVGLKVYDAITMQALPGQMEPGRESVCYEAMGLVFGSRRWAYGHPLDNFNLIADLWEPVLRRMVKDGRTRPTHTEVGLLFVLTKIAREMNSPKRDNIVDIAGYAEAAWQAQVEEKRRNNATERSA